MYSFLNAFLAAVKQILLFSLVFSIWLTENEINNILTLMFIIIIIDYHLIKGHIHLQIQAILRQQKLP